jgi:MFS superfamily sulfate permease-like transporter
MCPQQGEEEALMSLTMTIVMLISGWLAVAAAMLWGVLRITRRHHHPAQSAPVEKPDKTAEQHATAH